MKLRDLPKYGHLPYPEKRQPRIPRRVADRCPDCREGHVVSTGSDDPRDVRWRCSNRCGWDA